MLYSNAIGFDFVLHNCKISSNMKAIFLMFYYYVSDSKQGPGKNLSLQADLPFDLVSLSLMLLYIWHLTFVEVCALRAPF